MMTIAEILSELGQVDVLLDRHLQAVGAEYLKKALSERFNLKLDRVSFIGAPIGDKSSLFARTFFLKKYDNFFCLTDGSIFFPSAKKNILHIQSPLIGESKSLWRKIKLSNWDLIIYNSEFTRVNSEKNWPVKSVIVYPPVDTDKIRPGKKQKYILSVGRFFGFLKDKKQGLLVETFKGLLNNGQLKDWSLHLVGSAGEGDKEYLDDLRSLAEGLPVKFYPNLGYDKLIELYGQSDIYWHAAGFRETDPTKMEHFGISTVEAMAGGCVPVVIAKGGQKEIIEDTISGYLWESLDDLKRLTLKLVNEQNLRDRMSEQAIKRAKKFAKENFESNIMDLVKT